MAEAMAADALLVTGTAAKARARRQRAVARHVSWLSGLLQATSSHHTSGGACAGCTALTMRIAALEQANRQAALPKAASGVLQQVCSVQPVGPDPLHHTHLHEADLPSTIHPSAQSALHADEAPGNPGWMFQALSQAADLALDNLGDVLSHASAQSALHADDGLAHNLQPVVSENSLHAESNQHRDSDDDHFDLASPHARSDHAHADLPAHSVSSADCAHPRDPVGADLSVPVCDPLPFALSHVERLEFLPASESALYAYDGIAPKSSTSGL